MLDGVIDIALAAPMPDEDLWFNAAAEAIGGAAGFEAPGMARPLARRSAPVDTLAAWLLVSPRSGRALLEDVRSWGVERVSISVRTPMFQEVVRLVRGWDWLVNVWDVSRGSQLKDAIEARPASITADLGVLQPPNSSP